MEVVRKIWRCICLIIGFMPIQIIIIFISIYLCMAIFPNYLGCLLPEKMCMVGTNKINDILVVTATVMPSLLVIYGYKIWRGQKAKELLAVEAKDIYFELDKIIAALDVLDDQIKSNPRTTTTNSKQYIEFKRVSKEVLKELTLFKELLSEENSPYSEDFNNFYNELSSFDDGLEWINMWRIASGDRNPLVAAFEHYEEIKEKLKIQNMHDEIKNIKLKLAKIILHK